MKIVTFKILFIVSVLCLASCGGVSRNRAHTGASPELVNGKPYWFWKPNSTGKIGGVGISGPHVSGRNAQKELAIQRAIDDISKQLGSKVSTLAKKTTTGTNEGAYTSMEVYSIQTVSGQVVKAMINGLWQDPGTEELYVWMVVR